MINEHEISALCVCFTQTSLKFLEMSFFTLLQHKISIACYLMELCLLLTSDSFFAYVLHFCVYMYHVSFAMIKNIYRFYSLKVDTIQYNI